MARMHARCFDDHPASHQEFPRCPGDRTMWRAGRSSEIILATRLEQSLSKDRILELYLNEIFLGQNSYGVAAAAQTLFPTRRSTELTPAGGRSLGVTLPKERQ